MDFSREAVQRKEFCDILFELAKSQEKLQDAYYRSIMYKRLEALYYAPVPDKRFRHFYSDIFSVLTQIEQDPALGDINILGQNLAVLRSGYQSKNVDDNGETIDISDAIRKLCDHVSLDIARLLYIEAEDREISGEKTIQELKLQITGMTEEISKVQKAAQKQMNKVQEDAERKIENQQKEYIAILGIFAAVVLAFTGGIAFSTSVLNNIAQASAYRTVLVALIIGLILVNILFGLFFYINKIVFREEKIRPLIVSNAILLVLIILTVLLWNLGWIESRNRRVYQTDSEAFFQMEYRKSV